MREIKFRLTYKRRRDGHVWQLIVNPLEPGDGRRQMDSMLDNEEWQLIGEDQFTGLTDRNGQEMYEGDIVTYEYSGDRICPAFKNIGFVEWCKVSCEHGNEKMWTWGVNEAALDYCDWAVGSSDAVIGNIYENPELLEEI